jgi:phosphate transport system substrate-binding protein
MPALAHLPTHHRCYHRDNAKRQESAPDLMETASAAYLEVSDGVHVDYVVTSSVNGLAVAKGPNGVAPYAFGLASIVYTDAEYAANPGISLLPVAVGAIVPVVNLPGLGAASALVLDLPTLSAVFAGNCTRWDDPRLVALNPRLHMPAEAIRVIVRKPTSGITQTLFHALSDAVPAWKAREGATGAWVAPGLIVTTTPWTQMDAIFATPFSLSYVALSDAWSNELACVSLALPPASPGALPVVVTPSFGTIEAAVCAQCNEWTPRHTITYHGASSGSSWPLGNYIYSSWFSVNASTPAAVCASRDGAINFWRWFYTEEQGLREQVPFVSEGWCCCECAIVLRVSQWKVRVLL